MSASPCVGESVNVADTSSIETRGKGENGGCVNDSVGHERLYGVSPDGRSVNEYIGPGNWQSIAGAKDRLYAGEGGLFRTVPGSGDMYIYNGKPHSWSRVGGPGTQFAVGGPGKLYGISPANSALYQWSGTVSGKWTPIRSSVKQVYAAGDFVYAVDAISGNRLSIPVGPP